MTAILVVDDDRDYCDELGLALASSNCEVHKAYSGAQAIDMGLRLRPDILISDWMLRDNIDGLNVAEILELVNPQLRSILITGFASSDLRSNAKYQEVFEFLEKPFRSAEIREVLQRAVEASDTLASVPPIGILELNSKEEIIYANQCAQTLLDIPSKPQVPTSLNQLISIMDSPVAQPLARSWQNAEGIADKSKKFIVFRKHLSGLDTSILVILDQEHSSYSYEPLTYQLLGLHSPQARPVEVEGHVLIIDNFEQTRRVAAELLREFSCVCHTAQTHSEGYRLFERDPSIHHVILNFEMNRTKPIEFIRKLLKIRPQTRIIGTSSYGDLEEYAELGVVDFLPNPWTDEDLLKTMKSPSQMRGFHERH